MSPTRPAIRAINRLLYIILYESILFYNKLLNLRMVSGSRSLSESREDVISSWRFSNCSCCWTSSKRCSYNFTFYKYGTLSGLLSRALEMLSSSLAFSSRRVSTDERSVSSLRFFYIKQRKTQKQVYMTDLGKSSTRFAFQPFPG